MKCPMCNSTDLRIRQSVKSTICNNCGYEFLDIKRCILCGLPWNRCNGHGRLTTIYTTKTKEN